jgi:hypothetical protein
MLKLAGTANGGEHRRYHLAAEESTRGADEDRDQLRPLCVVT